MPRRLPTTARIGARSGGRASRSASVAARCGTPRDGERSDDFDIRQEWWTGDALPDTKVARRKLTGYPRPRWSGLSNEKVEEILWDTITQFRAELARVQRK